MKRNRVVRISVFLVAATLLVAGIRLGLGGSDRSDPPLSLGHAEYLYDFESLDQMVATSAAVVEATAVSVEQGPVLGGTYTDEDEMARGKESDGAVEYTSVTLKLDRVFIGQLDGDAVTFWNSLHLSCQ